MLVDDRDPAPELETIHRFRDAWERDASVHLRAGHPSAIRAYQEQGRISGGPRDDILDQLYEAWKTDIDAGKSSVMVAADAATVNELNSRARADRAATNIASDAKVVTATGNTLGVGDTVVTRRNNRDLAVPGGWVKNGDTWTLAALHEDRSATLTRASRTGAAVEVHVPADYVTEHLDLGYAMTAHRAQGRTVDTAHAYVAATTAREPLYVMATRGRETNRIYVDTTYDPDSSTAHDDLPETDPLAVLRGVLDATSIELSATETRATGAASDAMTIRARAEDTAHEAIARERRYTSLLRAAGFTQSDIAAAKAADQWRPLIAALVTAEDENIAVALSRRDPTRRPTLSNLTTELCGRAPEPSEAGRRVARVEGSRDFNPREPDWSLGVSP